MARSRTQSCQIALRRINSTSLRTNLEKCLSLTAFFGVLQATTLFATNWTLIDLGTLGGSETFADSINDLGQVVGTSRVPGDADNHAFFYADGVMQDISPINSGDIRAAGHLGLNNLGCVVSGIVVGDAYYPVIYQPQSMQTTTLGTLGAMSGFTGVATAINDSGVAVGYSYLSLGGPRHAFVYRNGTMSDLGSLGGNSGALAINSSGTAVGFATDSMNGFGRAVVWSNNSILDISNGADSEARGINDFGQVVGETTTLAGTHDAFLWNNGTNEYLGTLATGLNSVAYSINNHGDVVGTADVISSYTFITNPITHAISTITNYHNHAFLYGNGSMVDLNSLISTNSGWELYSAYGINNFDQIVGWGSTDGGEHVHSFILEVPEPSAPVLLFCASGALLAFRRWHAYGYLKR